MKVRQLSVGPFQANCFVVRSGDAIAIVDPGAEPDRIAAVVDEWDGQPQVILLTHAHVDHVGGVAGLARRYGIPVHLHADDLPLYRNAAHEGAMFGVAVEAPPDPDEWLVHGQQLRFGDLSFEVRHAPGHSPGGVVLVGESVAFVGDCVFSGSIGRTDLPGGDLRTLLTSIRDQILVLPEDTVLYSGHGPPTTVGVEASSNPFLTGDFG